MRACEGELVYSDVVGKALVVETERPWRLICWEKAQYVPCWDIGDAWVCAEWLETMGTKSRGYNFEPMHDKECRYTWVELLSKGNARCVVHWHYALNNTRYEMSLAKNCGNNRHHAACLSTTVSATGGALE